MFKPFKLNAIHGIVGLGSLGLALLFSVLGGIALNERETLWTLQIAKQHELQRLTLNNSQHELEQQAQLLAETFAADAWLVDLVRQAQTLTGGAPPNPPPPHTTPRQPPPPPSPPRPTPGWLPGCARPRR